MSAPVVCVSGTWGRTASAADSGSFTWWRYPSVFIANLRGAGLDLVSEDDGFDWSTGFDGMHAEHDVWETAGKSFYWWWVAHGRPALSVLGHSHGPQSVAYGLAYGVERDDPITLTHLVTVGTPVRGDMQPFWRIARPHITDWTHLYTEELLRPLDGDLEFQKLGSLPILPEFPFTRLMPLADRNVDVVPATTHHGLILSKTWLAHDLFQYLKD